MPAVASLADRLKQGLLRLSHQPAGGPDDEAVPAFKRSLERTLAKLTPGATPTPSPFRFQLTGGKALLFLGIDALPLDPAGIVRLLNSAGVDLQAGESLDLDGGLAAWVIRPEVTLTDNNLRQADITLRTLKSGRDRDHVAAQAAESAKIRLRSRLTQLVTALQSAQTDAQGKFTGPELPVVLEATPVPAAPPPPPKVPTPPPAPPPVVQAPPHPPPPPPPAPVPTGPSIDLLAKALRKLLAAVEGSGFKGAAIGDIAHAAWGSKIPPQKVEVLIAFEGPQREMLLSAARGEGLRAAPDGEPLHLEFTDAKLGGSVSVELIQATSTFRKQVLNRAQPGNVFQTGARLATCDDLILMRAGFSQPGHRESVIDLLRVAAGRLDAAYLKKEAESAGVFEQLKAAWKEAKAQV